MDLAGCILVMMYEGTISISVVMHNVAMLMTYHCQKCSSTGTKST